MGDASTRTRIIRTRFPRLLIFLPNATKLVEGCDVDEGFDVACLCMALLLPHAKPLAHLAWIALDEELKCRVNVFGTSVGDAHERLRLITQQNLRFETGRKGANSSRGGADAASSGLGETARIPDSLSDPDGLEAHVNTANFRNLAASLIIGRTRPSPSPPDGLCLWGCRHHQLHHHHLQAAQEPRGLHAPEELPLRPGSLLWAGSGAGS